MRQASAELGFDMSESIVIGDKESDVEFGRRAGALAMQIGNGDSRPSSAIAPDYVVADLKEAADIIGSTQA
jgi:phosphoglycolate phosphatase-like HAD superfamily hydrolase